MSGDYPYSQAVGREGRGMSVDYALCQRNGWRAGDVLEGEAGGHVDRITLRYVSPQTIVALWHSNNRESSTSLTCREWRRVGAEPAHLDPEAMAALRDAPPHRTTNCRSIVAAVAEPCPFCGAPARIEEDGPGIVYVLCTAPMCQACGPYRKSPARAAAVWNRISRQGRDPIAAAEAIQATHAQQIRELQDDVARKRQGIERLNSILRARRDAGEEGKRNEN